MARLAATGHINDLAFQCETAASYLAYEGQHEAVEMLRHYDASICRIVHGYAMGGHHTQVEHYRTVFNAPVDKIVRGYAMGAHHTQVEHYRTVHRASVDTIAHGYKAGGYLNQTGDILHILGALNLPQQDLELVSALVKIAPPEIAKKYPNPSILYKKSQQLQHCMTTYDMDFNESGSWVLHAQTLAVLIYARNLPIELGGEDVLNHILSYLIAVPNIADFTSKIKHQHCWQVIDGFIKSFIPSFAAAASPRPAIFTSANPKINSAIDKPSDRVQDRFTKILCILTCNLHICPLKIMSDASK